MIIIQIANIIMTLINIGIVVFKFKYSFESYFYSQNFWLDSLFCLVNLLIIGFAINYEPTQAMRIFEAFGILLLGTKSLYFLEMHRKIAPLILIFF
jgi:hypothetical protein